MKLKETEVDSFNKKLAELNDENHDLTSESNRLEKETEKVQG